VDLTKRDGTPNYWPPEFFLDDKPY